jgi:hypothetical protein
VSGTRGRARPTVPVDRFVSSATACRIGLQDTLISLDAPPTGGRDTVIEHLQQRAGRIRRSSRAIAVDAGDR